MPDQACIVVVGTGVARGVPDQCVLQIALNAIADTPALALDQCAEAADHAVSALTQKGVDRRDVRTTHLSVQDLFDQSTQKVTARIGSYQMETTIRTLGDVGRVVAALSTAVGDALQIRSMYLAVNDASALEQEGRRLAVLNAQLKASELAKAANVRLGPILSIQDEGSNSGSPYQPRPMRAMPVYAATSVPIEPGEVASSSSVTIAYAIDG